MTAAEIRNLALESGACAAGVVACTAVADGDIALLDSWLDSGCHGEMDYLHRNFDLCKNPESLLEGAAMVICTAFAYLPTDASDRSPLFADYARGADYHKALRKRLKPVCGALEAAIPGSSTRICVDSAPMRERYWAVAAGLGYLGLNGQLFVPGVGSKVFLAEILWTGRPDGEMPSILPRALPSPACLQCGKCVQACPGGALDGYGGLDARKCLSYKTIECRNPLEEPLPANLRIYGCDICQDVCPQNSTAHKPLPEFTLRPEIAALSRDNLAQLTEPEYDQLTIGSAIRRAPLAKLRSNATPTGPNGR